MSKTNKKEKKKKEKKKVKQREEFYVNIIRIKIVYHTFIKYRHF